MNRYNKYQAKQLHTYMHLYAQQLVAKPALAGLPPMKTIRASVSAMLTLWRVINAITFTFYISQYANLQHWIQIQC